MKWRRLTDERQQQENGKITAAAFWVMWGVLLAGIVVEGYINGKHPKEYIWVLAAFLIGNTILLAGSVRKGIWDDWLKPKWSSYLLCGLTAGVLGGILFVIGFVKRGEEAGLPIAAYGGIFFAAVFGMTFVLAAVVGELTKRRNKKIEKELDNEEEE